MLVSVVVPVYKAEAYLAETLDSILASTYREIEVILVNDGSRDKSAEICKHYAAADARVMYIEQPNAGVVAARNHAISVAKGRYILPVDSDDRIAPTYIEKAVAVMEQDKDMGIVYCEAAYFGDRQGKWELPPYSLAEMLYDNVIFVTALFRREDWEAVGGFKSCMEGYCEDYELWLSIIERGRKVYRLPEVLFFYRIRKGSRTSSLRIDYERQLEGARKIYEMHQKLYADHMDLVCPGLLMRYREENISLQEKIHFIKKWIPDWPILRYAWRRLKKYLKSGGVNLKGAAALWDCAWREGHGEAGAALC